MSGFARGLLGVVGVAVLAFAALVVLVWAIQRQLIYLPTTASPGPAADEVEEVTYRTEDGLDLDAWFVPARDDPVSTVVVANGNAGHRGVRLPLAQGLAERGHAVLLTDYRGYGGNPGSPDEEGITADIRAAVGHLRERDETDGDRLVYLGESLGTGPVAAVAAEDPPAGVVLRSPFPALADVGATHYPFLPVRALLRDRFPVTEHLAAYPGPTLVVAGDADRIVPTELSREVAEELGADLVEVPGADHNDRALLDGEEFLDAVDGFIREAVERSGT